MWLDLEKDNKKQAKEMAEAEKKYKVRITTRDCEGEEFFYFADNFTIEGDFVRFYPKHCLGGMTSYGIDATEIILPSKEVLEIVKRVVKKEPHVGGHR